MGNPIKKLDPERLGWRTLPGMLGRHASSPQSVHALLGYFLKDRKSPTPFPAATCSPPKGFSTGACAAAREGDRDARPLRVLLGMPEIYRQSVAIVEPWANVGINPLGEPVRASKNVAYILQQVADADTILFPVWQSGIRHPERLANVLSAGIATIVQGGNPSVHDAEQLRRRQRGPRRPAHADRPAAAAPLLRQRTQHLHLPRPPARGGVAHPAAQAGRARGLGTRPLPLDARGHALAITADACERIAAVGERLQVIKEGEVRATGWHDAGFAVARNEEPEIGTRRLLPYARRKDDRTCRRNCTTPMR